MASFLAHFCLFLNKNISAHVFASYENKVILYKTLSKLQPQDNDDWPLSNHPQKPATLIKGGGGGLRCKIPCFTWTGSNMPQGMLIGVPEGGSTSGIGRWGRRVERGGWEVIWTSSVRSETVDGVSIVVDCCFILVGGTVVDLRLELLSAIGVRNSQPLLWQ